MKFKLFERSCTGKRHAPYAKVQNRRIIVRMCGTGFKATNLKIPVFVRIVRKARIKQSGGGEPGYEATHSVYQAFSLAEGGAWGRG